MDVDDRPAEPASADNTPNPIRFSTNGPAVTSPDCQSEWPRIAASPKKTVAVTIADRCQVAVHQSGVRRVIVNQSASPVSAVATV